MKKNIVWIKTPRCGGTALKKLLIKNDLFHKAEFTGPVPDEVIKSKKVITVFPDHKDQFQRDNQKLWDNAFKFAIIRNPYDKFVSGWKALEQAKRRPFGPFTLKEILLDLPTKKGHYNGWVHLTQTQVSILENESGFIDFTRFVRFENLQSELGPVFKLIGIPGAIMPRCNLSKRAEYRTYFDDETRKIFEKKYWLDLRIFKYKY